MRTIALVLFGTVAVTGLARAAVPPPGGQIEATIRANGFPCEKAVSIGPTKKTEQGEGTMVTCDGQHRYLLVYRRDAPVLVVVDR